MRITSRGALNKSFDKLRTINKLLIPFVVSLSNHERNQLVQRLPKPSRKRMRPTSRRLAA